MFFRRLMKMPLKATGRLLETTSETPPENINAIKERTMADDQNNRLSAKKPRNKKAISQFQAQLYEGPIPPPGLLREFDELVPGSAKQIIDNAHAQSEHRRAMERGILDHESRSTSRGQWFAFLIALSILAISVFLISQGKSLEGLALLAVEVGGIIFAFVKKTSSKGVG